MKRSLTKWITAGLLAGAMLVPTVAHALPVAPVETVRAVADSLPVNPFNLLSHSNPTADLGLPIDVLGTATSAATSVAGTIRGALPVGSTADLGLPIDVLGTATSVAGTIRGALPVDPVAGMPRPASLASSAQPAVTVPPRVPCLITPAVSALPIDIARHVIAMVGENFPASLVCLDGQSD